ncbi:MAG: hypothetical protein LLF96_00615 [Eubacteriales bacterium]|nr:hypothetical protein [Eubacteriales bacterium]
MMPFGIQGEVILGALGMRLRAHQRAFRSPFGNLRGLHLYRGTILLRIEDFPSHYERFMHREVNKAQLAKELKISRPTLDKLIMEHKEKLGA